jgi:hypothetical protein
MKRTPITCPAPSGQPADLSVAVYDGSVLAGTIVERADRVMSDAATISTFAERQLQLFAVRCQEIVERVDAGMIGFIDGVDMAYSAALWSGLIDAVGDDSVQAIMAQKFMRVRQP